MVPAISCPNGVGALSMRGWPPRWNTLRSVPQVVAAPTRSSSSPSPGTGTGTSRISSRSGPIRNAVVWVTGRSTGERSERDEESRGEPLIRPPRRARSGTSSTLSARRSRARATASWNRESGSRWVTRGEGSSRRDTSRR